MHDKWLIIVNYNTAILYKYNYLEGLLKITPNEGAHEATYVLEFFKTGNKKGNVVKI